MTPNRPRLKLQIPITAARANRRLGQSPTFPSSLYQPHVCEGPFGARVAISIIDQRSVLQTQNLLNMPHKGPWTITFFSANIPWWPSSSLSLGPLNGLILRDDLKTTCLLWIYRMVMILGVFRWTTINSSLASPSIWEASLFSTYCGSICRMGARSQTGTA